MAIAFDTTSNVGVGTGNLSWTHTPVGTPKGVIVLIAQNAGTTDEITSVTYGGVAMGEVVGSPLQHLIGTEDGALYGYFLGTGIPTGAKTVTVTVSGASSKRAVCYTVTADSDTEVEDTTATDLGVVTNPSVNITLGTGVSAFIAAVCHSGTGSVVNINADTGCTTILGNDFGAQCASWLRRTNIETGAGDFAAAWTCALDESAILAVAIKEGSTWVPKLVMF